MGRLIAELHVHGESWQPPETTTLLEMNSVMMDMPNLINGLTWASRRAARTLKRAHEEPDSVLAPIFAAPTHVIHADVHLWNTKWHDDQISVFDFEDCGLGVPLQDVAISAFCIRDMPRHEAALLDGYREIRPLPDHTPEQYEALVASRSLLLLNSVGSQVTAGSDEFVVGHLDRTAHRMKHWLDTGTFTLDPP